MINYFKSISTEMKKVSWLSKSEMVNSTLIVFAFSFVILFFLFLLDFGLSELVKLIFDLNVG
ncbi:MAG: preprotein translocase subunit SecE [Candidatus Marinimicrobia bacterium]|nr:preprotein translocase subunit SecE [Candidatus Neomarinimicrobiota bacterium]